MPGNTDGVASSPEGRAEQSVTDLESDKKRMISREDMLQKQIVGLQGFQSNVPEYDASRLPRYFCLDSKMIIAMTPKWNKGSPGSSSSWRCDTYFPHPFLFYFSSMPYHNSCVGVAKSAVVIYTSPLLVFAQLCILFSLCTFFSLEKECI